MLDKHQILQEYDSKIARLKAAGSARKELQPLSVQEVIYIRAILHPTARAASRELTKELIKFVCEVEVCTAADIMEHLGASNKPVMQRLRKFKEMGLIRRESKRFYLRTERLIEMRDKYLDKMCGV